MDVLAAPGGICLWWRRIANELPGPPANGSWTDSGALGKAS
jgi:hypothetical protein